MERGLRGRVAVVTGASSGIGEACARALAHGGAKVALLARRLDRVEALAKELHADGAEALAVGADVTDQAALDAAAATVAGRFGRADILVNGAGMMLLGRFDTQDPAEWQHMIQVNLIGAMQATAAFLDQLTAGGGDLVNISSVAGRKARATTSAYNASKWGLNGWSDALRQELIEARVRVIVVEPGAVRTRLADHISDDQLQADTRQMWDDVGAMEADDVADLVVYAVTRPDRVALHEVLIRPTGQVF